MKKLGMTAVALALFTTFSAVLFGFALAVVPPVAAESRKPSPGQEGPLVDTKKPIPISPEWLPDLVVSSATATAKCLPDSVTAKIVATVKNQSPKGTAYLSKITWHIILEADWWFTGGNGFLEKNPSVKPVKPQLGGPKTLKPGESWTGTLTISGIPKVNIPKAKKGGYLTSQYGFKVTADPTNGVAEADEKNNVKLTYSPNPCLKQ